jgi:hypothetical protein
MARFANPLHRMLFVRQFTPNIHIYFENSYECGIFHCKPSGGGHQRMSLHFPLNQKQELRLSGATAPARQNKPIAS